MGKQLNLGDVVSLEGLQGQYVVLTVSLTGGGTGHGPHDVYPDGYQVVARRLQRRLTNHEVYEYDPDGAVVKFTQFDMPGASSYNTTRKHTFVRKFAEHELLSAEGGPAWYVISLETEGEAIKYIRRGDYHRFGLTTGLGNSQLFISEHDAREALKDSGFTKRNYYTDGSTTPPHLLWDGLGINNAKPTASGTLRIMRVTMACVYEQQVAEKLTPKPEKGEEDEITRLRRQVLELGGDPIA